MEVIPLLVALGLGYALNLPMPFYALMAVLWLADLDTRPPRPTLP